MYIFESLKIVSSLLYTEVHIAVNDIVIQTYTFKYHKCNNVNAISKLINIQF